MMSEVEAWAKTAQEWMAEAKRCRATIATLTAERDAAIRERDEARRLHHEACEITDDANAQRIRLINERAALVVQLDEPRRSGLTLTAEERAALEWLGRYVAEMLSPVSETPAPAHMPVWAIRNTIDRLLAGARTVTEPTEADILTVGEACRDPEYVSGDLVISIFYGPDEQQMRARDEHGGLLSESHHATAHQTRWRYADGSWSRWAYSDHIDDRAACRLLIADAAARGGK